MRPAESVVEEEIVVGSVIIGYSDLIGGGTTDFFRIAFASRSPEPEDRLRSAGRGFHPGVVSLLPILYRVGGLIVVGSGSFSDLRFNLLHGGEELPMSFLDDRCKLSIGHRETV